MSNRKEKLEVLDIGFKLGWNYAMQYHDKSVKVMNSVWYLRGYEDGRKYARSGQTPFVKKKHQFIVRKAGITDSDLASDSADVPTSGRARISSFQLCIKKLKADVDDDKLRSMFEKFGDIICAKVIKQDGGKSKQFGFVSFKTKEAAARAIHEMHLKEQSGGMGPLYVAYAQTKQERQARLARRFAKPRGGYRGGRGGRGVGGRGGYRGQYGGGAVGRGARGPPPYPYGGRGGYYGDNMAAAAAMQQQQQQQPHGQGSEIGTREEKAESCDSDGPGISGIDKRFGSRYHSRDKVDYSPFLKKINYHPTHEKSETNVNQTKKPFVEKLLSSVETRYPGTGKTIQTELYKYSITQLEDFQKDEGAFAIELAALHDRTFSTDNQDAFRRVW